ncbi:MAG: YbjN domain-containing protein [Stackebrandtia sp.]
MEELLEGLGVDWEHTGDKSYVVTLPGTHKLKTLCNLIVEDHALRVEAFVVRCPEENAEQVWRLLLRRNAQLYGVAFAIDDAGDVYLMGRAPLASIDAAEIDRLLGAVLTYADEIFDLVLEVGFASSIRREWAWRLSRGESTRNLAAFEHLRPDSD